MRRPPRPICTGSALALSIIGALTVAATDCSAEGWVDHRQSGPFLCRAEFSLQSWDELLGELAQIQDCLVRYLGVPPAEGPIEVFLFSNKQSYAKYLAKHLPDVPYRRALFIKSQGVGRVYAYDSKELATDLRHECTHALLHAVLPLVPLWLDEGLAEYFEVPSGQRAFDHPHLKSVRWAVRFGKKPKLEDLENKGSIGSMGKSDYRYAWAWVHFMFHGSREAHGELVRFFADLRASSPPGLLSRRLRHRIRHPEKHLVTHFKTWKR